MEEEDKFPFIPDDLLSALNTLFPEINPPNALVSPEELWMNIGMRKVVLFLQFKKAQDIEKRQAHV